ncbi:MAG: HlyD family efflux transporter periplasmic adaptor subunit, partial [Proteobacteria bacterium]|nr:HlyD family efflux transporter periplasmic adaptor subunit [Pseudomonadota bacterium]
LRAIQRSQEYRKEVDTQLSEVRREVQADAEKYKASTQELGRTVIRAPSEGQVLGLTVQSVGAVVGPGQKLMDIVPKNETLLLEAKVPPHLIDKVHAGLEVDVRFSSFAHSPSLVVQGKLESISSDLLSEQNGSVYYLARISITPEGMKELGNRQMQAGMPAEVVIKTGERTVLTYLLHPLFKRMAASMKEE